MIKRASKGLSEVTWLVEKTMGASNDVIASAMFGMARVLEMQGKLQEARAEYERALDTRSKIWQVRPPSPALASKLGAWSLISEILRVGDVAGDVQEMSTET